ncbi:MAG: hypothetical protein KR126chlam5_00842 [Candidatus Anoxychlamydiales bacterium]|nr:hypothetical protein [Candidatus Anoxychlamydiales bacterium]
MFIIHKDWQGKPTSETAIDNRKIEIFDEKMSLGEVFFGGRILNLVNDVARKVATDHAEIRCITTCVDCIRYFSPIKAGDILTCKAQVNHVWDDMIEVGVKVIAEDFRSLEQKHILSTYFIFKADESENSLPFVIPFTLEEKRRFLDAEIRKNIRQKRNSFTEESKN